jgi:hypothetical protein
MPVVRLSYPDGALTQMQKTASAPDVARLIVPALAAARRAEIERAIGRK